MKAKQLILGFAVAIAITACKKPATAPVADTDVQSSVNASYALFCITDAEMVTSFIASNDLAPKFYEPAPGSPGGFTTIQVPEALQINAIFGSPAGNTTSFDGHVRNGSILMDRTIDPGYNPNANNNSVYYYRFGFSGRLTMSEYIVDGWHIVTTNADNSLEGQPCVINNILPIDNFNPATTNLSWSIKGNFKLTNGSDEMFCKVDLVKTLVNTNDVAVFPATRNAIHWPVAKVAYSGTVSGYTQGHVPFNMTIDASNPIIRDFTCTPDKVSNVTVGPNSMTMQQISEFHPFKDGVAYLTTGDLYPREIYYGGLATAGNAQCDNSGVIRIKGISYPVDFKK